MYQRAVMWAVACLVYVATFIHFAEQPTNWETMRDLESRNRDHAGTKLAMRVAYTYMDILRYIGLVQPVHIDLSLVPCTDRSGLLRTISFKKRCAAVNLTDRHTFIQNAKKERTLSSSTGKNSKAFQE
jgi:hypothetical protein